MGNTLSSLLDTLGGVDVDRSIDKRKAEELEATTNQSASPKVPAPDVILTKPKNPFRAVQIERAWQEFASVCDNVENAQSFDIEYDLELEKPVRVALLDTGVYQDHNSLLGRVTRVRNFVPRRCQQDANEDLILDWNGHGTFCAGLAVGGAFAAKPEDGGPEEQLFKNGVAPFAKLVVGKVIDKEGRTDIDWLIKGLKWACDIDRVDSRRLVNADVICIPSGFPRYHPELRNILYQAIQKGKVIVCCAGGEGDEATYDIQYPARFGDVICIGSQAENGQPTTFTPAGREIDFLAPGDNIWSASQRGTASVRCDSATSYSVAIMAGICALVIAYAEKLGGKDLRRLVSHVTVMKEVLRRMSASPGHHDRIAGHGNVIPYRLLKYGPQTFFNEVCNIVHQVDASVDVARLTNTLGPLQPMLSNFNATAVMAAHPIDKGAVELHLLPLIKARVVYKWFEMLEDVFTSPVSIHKISHIRLMTLLPKCLREVDFTIPGREFQKITEGKQCSGINLTNIVELYFGQESVHSTIKLILPEFDHLSHYDADKIYQHIKPSTLIMQGDVPITYLMDTVCALVAKEYPVTIICERLSFGKGDSRNSKTLVERIAGLQKKLHDEADRMHVHVFISDVTETLEQDVNQLGASLACLCSAALLQLFSERRWHLPQTSTDVSRGIFFTQDEQADGGHTPVGELPESSQIHPENAQNQCETFSVWPDIKSILTDKRKDIALSEFALKAKPIASVLLKGYEGAMTILSSASLDEKVTSIDLRLAHVSLPVPINMDLASVMPRTQLKVVPSDDALKELALIEEDVRSIALSGVFRSLNIKLSKTCEIHEIVVPCLDRFCDIEDSFSCSLWRKCRNLYIPSETKFSDLLQILRLLPKGDYSLTIHVEKLKLENSLAGEKARDFDTPDGIKVLCYSVYMDPLFFQMCEQTIKSFYEVSLKLSSPSCLEFLKEQCETFLRIEETFAVPYSCCNCYTACQMLQGYLQEALDEELVDGDEAIINFSPEVFKFNVMSAGIGRQRYRRAFYPVDSDRIYKLPANAYRSQLPNIKGIFSALKTGKIQNVTVAILGSGINAFHPDFNLKIGQARTSGRDKACPFGESIAGLAFNAYPKETMQTFLDQDCCMGTICASLVAGKTKGAAPFANIISLKVTNSSYNSKPEYVNAALSWLLDQEEKTYLPPVDVILIPFNFHQMSFELHRILNHICALGKIVICSTAKAEGLPAPRSGPMPIGYPGAFGDVICIGAHSVSGDVLRGGGLGRTVDLCALGELDESPQVSWVTPLAKVQATIAAAQVTGVVAYLLAYAELTGGSSLRQAITNNSVMRELLRQMCSKPGQHDERSGYGCLSPNTVLKYGGEHLQKVVSDVTEEYYAISTSARIRATAMSAHSVAMHKVAVDAPSRSRSSSFTMRGERKVHRRTRTHSETLA